MWVSLERMAMQEVLVPKEIRAIPVVVEELVLLEKLENQVHQDLKVKKDLRE